MLNDRPALPRVLRIVVVEDNLDAVHTTALLLREMGHVVDYAINGYVALDVIRRFRPDYVILDLGLPGMSGFEVCAQIKADPEVRSTPVVAVTAYSDAKFRQQAREAGFDGYYVKPLLPDALRELFGEPLKERAGTGAFHSP